MDTDWIAPIIASSLGGAALILGGLITYRNNRRGAVENRAPSTGEAWAEADRARRREQAIESLFWDVLGALKHLVRTIRQQQPDYVFTDDITEALKAEPPADEAAKKK